MNTITELEWIQKIIDNTDNSDPENPIPCPTEVRITAGKCIVRAFYNNRWYEWELVE